MKSSDNKKLTYIVVAMCFMLLVFGVSIGYNLTRNNRNYSSIDEPKLGDTSISMSVNSTRTVSTGQCTSMAIEAGTCTVSWRSDDTSIATVAGSGQSATITGKKAGSAKITATITMDSGETSTDIWNVTVSAETNTEACYCAGAGQKINCSWRSSPSPVYTVSTPRSKTDCEVYDDKCYIDSSGTYVWDHFYDINSNTISGYTRVSESNKTSCEARNVTATLVSQIVIPECTNGTINMKVGDAAQQLTTIVTPDYATNKSIRWTGPDSDDGISYDANGYVTPLSPGNYVMTATARDGSGASASCTIIVSPETVSKPVTGITLSATSIKLAPSKTTTLTATISPSDATNKDLKWFSNKESVATVTGSGNRVTINAVSVGTATITVRAQDGSNQYAQAEVTVTEDTDIVLDKIYVNGRENEVYYLALPVSSSDTDGSIMTAGLTARNTINVGIEEGITWAVERTSGSTATAVIKDDAVVFTATGQASSTTQMLKNVFRVTGTYNGVSKTQEVTVWIYCPWTKTNYLDSNDNLTTKIEVDTSKYTSRMGKRFESGCTAYEGNKPVDGKSYYTARYDRCCGTSGGGTTTKSYACYANAPTIEYATQAQWLSEKTGVYQYQLAGVKETDCYPSACYKNGTTLENSTDVKWFRVDQVPSGYTVVAGVSRDNCVKADEGCYGNGQTYAQSTHVTWSITRPNGYYKLAEIDNEPACKDPEDHPACYLNTASGEYVWGDYRDKGTLGFEFVPAVTVEDYCKKPAPELNFACYKDSNGLYYWGDYSGDSGYTLISGITDSTKCGDPQEEACYKNGDKYEWGTFVNVTGYKLEETIRSSSECQNEACYKNKTSGNYEWGKHANDDNYTLVSNLTNKDACNNDIDVPQTAANVETIIYVGIAVLVMAGLTFMYYAFNNKHEY